MKKLALKTKIILIAAAALILAAGAYYFLLDRAFDLTTRLIQKDLMDISIPDSEKMGNQQIDSPKPQENLPNSENPPSQDMRQSSENSRQDEAKAPGESAAQNISPQDLASRISFEDKQRIMHLVMKKLSSEDVKYLMGLLKGGLTPEEKRLAMDMAYSRFTPEELNEIKNYYKKYMK
ncbi:MAG: hypothetical protein NUV45_13260 [Tepidanaerobacteraceae bacterium]|jgi:hypothetical protein|nr:hypothetical protein [Tepidanaerobacteraceae bacterium]